MVEQSELRTESTGKPVLELRGVSYRGKSEHSINLSHFDITLNCGQLLMIRTERSQRTRDFASLLQGLEAPSSGEIRFQSHRWDSYDFDREFDLRGRIGRVFDGQAWIENLNVAENVTLKLRHHRVTSDRIEAEVNRWVMHLEMTELSRQRPAFLEPSVLQMHQWIRAFAGSPSLLILERPMHLVPKSRLPLLLSAVNQLRREGAAVVWLSSAPTISDDDALPPARVLHCDQQQLLTDEGDSRDE